MPAAFAGFFCSVSTSVRHAPVSRHATAQATAYRVDAVVPCVSVFFEPSKRSWRFILGGMRSVSKADKALLIDAVRGLERTVIIGG